MYGHFAGCHSMSQSTPPFFFHGPSPLTRLVVCLLLSTILIILDSVYHVTERAHTVVGGVVYPMLRVLSWPVHFFLRSLDMSFSVEATQQLADQLARSQVALLRQGVLLRENYQLRDLLRLQRRHILHFLAGDVVYALRDPFFQTILIDRGAAGGVHVSSPVINARGVLGQVVHVYANLSEAQLLINPEQAIPVQIERSSVLGVAVGAGDGAHLLLRYLPNFDDLQVGDRLVTSGLGGVYPRGLPVGEILEMDRHPSYPRVVVQPYARLSDGFTVFIVQTRDGSTKPVATKQDTETTSTKTMSTK